MRHVDLFFFDQSSSLCVHVAFCFYASCLSIVSTLVFSEVNACADAPLPCPFAVDGVHDQRQHGQRSQGIPDRGGHQQDLCLCKTSRGSDPPLMSSLRFWCSSFRCQIEEGGCVCSSLNSRCFLLFLKLLQEAAWTVTDECVQVMGGMGYMKVSSSGVFSPPC